MTDTEARYASHVAPMPEDVHPADMRTDGIVRDIARHHIARAYGFSVVAFDVENPRQAEALRCFLPSFELALVWRGLADSDDVSAPDLAVAVVAAVFSPEETEWRLAQLMEWADLDPTTIRPYMMKEA